MLDLILSLFLGRLGILFLLPINSEAGEEGVGVFVAVIIVSKLAKANGRSRGRENESRACGGPLSQQ